MPAGERKGFALPASLSEIFRGYASKTGGIASGIKKEASRKGRAFPLTIAAKPPSRSSLLIPNSNSPGDILEYEYKEQKKNRENRRPDPILPETENA